MKIRLLASLCIVAVLPVLQGASAAPPIQKAPGSQPPKPAATATPPLAKAGFHPINLPDCAALGTVTFDSAYAAKWGNAVQFVGPMTFTAQRDLWAVNLATLMYDDGHGKKFLGNCTCPQCPKGGDNPTAAPLNSNFKNLESRTYQLSCAWPTAGDLGPGPFRFEVWAYYFLKDAGGAWQKSSSFCGKLTAVK